MSEPLLRHEVVGLESCLEIVQVDSDGGTHEHVLGTLHDLALAFEKVGALESFKAEEIVLEVAGIVDDLIDSLVIGLDHLISVFGEEGCVTALLVLVIVKLVCYSEHAVVSGVVESLHSDSVGELSVIRMHNGHVGTSLSYKGSDFSRSDTWENTKSEIKTKF